MKFLQKLERKYGKYAIPHLMKYIIILYVIGWFVQIVDVTRYGGNGLYAQYLALDVRQILHGQIWRIVTFIIMPPQNSNYLFMAITLYLYYMLGTSLENAWGAFRFNLYFIMGVLFQVLAAFFLYFTIGVNLNLTTYYLNLSLFFAFATVYPNIQFLLFFIIPIKVKWLALIDGGYFVYVIITNFMMGGAGVALAVSAIVSLLNFAIFFLMTRNYKRVSPQEIHRKRSYRREVNRHRQNGVLVHTCAICGRTSETNPELSFRFCSKCSGNKEYCQEHLFTHEHVK